MKKFIWTHARKCFIKKLQCIFFGFMTLQSCWLMNNCLPWLSVIIHIILWAFKLQQAFERSSLCNNTILFFIFNNTSFLTLFNIQHSLLKDSESSIPYNSLINFRTWVHINLFHVFDLSQLLGRPFIKRSLDWELTISHSNKQVPPSGL